MMKTFIALSLALSTASHAWDLPNMLLLMAEDMSLRVGAFGDSVAAGRLLSGTPGVMPRLAGVGERQGSRFLVCKIFW